MIQNFKNQGKNKTLFNIYIKGHLKINYKFTSQQKLFRPSSNKHSMTF